MQALRAAAYNTYACCPSSSSGYALTAAKAALVRTGGYWSSKHSTAIAYWHSTTVTSQYLPTRGLLRVSTLKETAPQQLTATTTVDRDTQATPGAIALLLAVAGSQRMPVSNKGLNFAASTSQAGLKQASLELKLQRQNRC
jgi:hypothetical protein